MISEQLVVMPMDVHVYVKLELKMMGLVTRLIIKAIICTDLVHLVSIIVILPTENVDFTLENSRYHMKGILINVIFTSAATTTTTMKTTITTSTIPSATTTPAATTTHPSSASAATNIEWSLVVETKECGGQEISKGNRDSVDECAKACNGVASMFALGTNDFGTTRCYADGCACLCETGAKDDGTCDTVDHKGYHLYRFGTSSKYYCYFTNRKR